MFEPTVALGMIVLSLIGALALLSDPYFKRSQAKREKEARLKDIEAMPVPQLEELVRQTLERHRSHEEVRERERRDVQMVTVGERPSTGSGGMVYFSSGVGSAVASIPAGHPGSGVAGNGGTDVEESPDLKKEVLPDRNLFDYITDDSDSF